MLYLMKPKNQFKSYSKIHTTKLSKNQLLQNVKKLTSLNVTKRAPTSECLL